MYKGAMDAKSLGLLGLLTEFMGEHLLLEHASEFPVVKPVKGSRMESVLGKEKHVLVGNAIETPEAYASGQDSTCHLSPNGTIWRYGKVVGSREDIEIVDP